MGEIRRTGTSYNHRTMIAGFCWFGNNTACLANCRHRWRAQLRFIVDKHDTLPFALRTFLVWSCSPSAFKAADATECRVKGPNGLAYLWRGSSHQSWQLDWSWVGGSYRWQITDNHLAGLVPCNYNIAGCLSWLSWVTCPSFAKVVHLLYPTVIWIGMGPALVLVMAYLAMISLRSCAVDMPTNKHWRLSTWVYAKTASNAVKIPVAVKL